MPSPDQFDPDAMLASPEVNWQNYITVEREQYLANAQLEGLEIVYPRDNELQLDIDSEPALETFSNLWEIFKKHIDQEYDADIDFICTRSKSMNWHISITLPFTIDHWQRQAWQAALGSDPVRELLGCLRTLYNDPHPSLLLKVKKDA